MRKKKVVITGIGLLAPNGVGTAEVWENCINGVTNVASIPTSWHTYYESKSQVWARLPSFDPAAFGVTRSELRRIHLSQTMFLSTAHMALTHAGFRFRQMDAKKNNVILEDVDPYSFGVFYGTGCGGLTTAFQTWQVHTRPAVTQFTSGIMKLLNDEQQQQAENIVAKGRFNPFAVSMVMPNAGSSRASIKFGAKGPNRTFCASCASGTVAVGQAFRSIQAGECSVALAAGSEFVGDENGCIFRGFDVPGTLAHHTADPEKANRPFDAERSGFLFSEGASATLVLEDAAHAVARGANIIAEVVGYAENSDAYSLMAIESTGASIRRMLADLLADAAVDAQDIDYVNCHGTATVLNDETESVVLEALFGNKPYLNSTKSILGHSIGASGAIEAAITALSLQSSKLHPSLNLESPIRPLNWVLNGTDADIQYGISESFGFGGHNAAICLKKWI